MRVPIFEEMFKLRCKVFMAYVLVFLLSLNPFFTVGSVWVLAEGEENVEEILVEDTVQDTPTLEISQETPVETEISTTTEISSETEDNLVTEEAEILDATTTPEVVLEISETEVLGTTTIATTTLETSAIATSTEATSTATSTLETSLGSVGSTTEEIILPEGTTTIDTGDSVSTANVLNIVNTNSINSTGTIQMVNLENGSEQSMDFRTDVQQNNSSTTCNLSECSGVDSIQAKIDDDANIDNVLAIGASSGGNAISNSNTAIINTGDTYSGLNLVNVANTNIIDSNYFFLALNSFGDFNGDIVLPSLLELLSGLSPLGENTTLDVYQSAEVNNDFDITANTGENESSNTLNSVTNTGDALTVTNLYNSLNNNFFGGKSITILLRVTGEWIGSILGLNSDVDFEKDGDLYSLHIEDGQVSDITPVKLALLGTSTVKINNDIEMFADSGKNKIEDVNNAVINTGSAISAANVINLANTNIVGKNWMLAVINIFGDFRGNIAFGRPDLVLTQEIDPSNTLQNGSVLTNTFFVKNIGDSLASEVRLQVDYDESHLNILNTSVPYVVDDSNNIIFHLGKLAAGEDKEIIFTYSAKDVLPFSQLDNVGQVVSKEKDNNPQNNSSSIVIGNPVWTPQFTLPRAVTSETNNIFDQNATATDKNFQLTINNFSVTREVENLRISKNSATTTQKIILRNLTNQKITNVFFHDIISDQNGVELQRETWDLGTVEGREEITLTYDILFNKDIEQGMYDLGSEVVYGSDQLIGFYHNGSIWIADENEALTPETVAEGKPEPKVFLSDRTLLKDTSTIAMSIPEEGPILFEDNSPQEATEDSLYYFLLLFLSSVATGFKYVIRIF